MASRVLVLLSFLVSMHAWAGEPAWCNPKNFNQYEQTIPTDGLVRAHGYKIGTLTFIGLAVGKSDIESTRRLAENLAGVPVEGVKSCTWYYNDNNPDSIKAFNHQYLPHPYPWSSKTKIADEYSTRLTGVFVNNDTNILECAQTYHYFAMGCHGQKHRGPSAFAYFLGLSGCSAENANKIANNIWGLNTVPSATRKAIAQKGVDLGNANPQVRAAFQALMSAAR